MIYLYPANKMENLLALLDKIQHVSPLPFFSSETIVVQNAGMQHWLNLSLAKYRGISMNIDYALPAQYLWKLIRTLASDEVVPDQSPYSREVLTWRIFALLAEDCIVNDSDFYAVTGYWQSDLSHQKSDEQAKLKRYQLAQQIADLYEQYLIFRPDWVDQWSSAEFSVSNTFHFNRNKSIDNVHKNENEPFNLDAEKTALWQGKLWALLTKEQPYNPKTLIKDALENLANKTSLLPKRLSFFGLNAMAPIWLDFIHSISEYTEVHFFHLNPCCDYWGDIVSQKEAFKLIDRWTKDHQSSAFNLGNPLLANLGQQGREFMAMLQAYSTVNIDIFEDAHEQGMTLDVPMGKVESGKVNKQPSLLAAVQQDILTLEDAKHSSDVLDFKDDSITITSCHSALREVQGLHDWLLHQFNQSSTLTPKDVIVMCPQIENYAPYIDAVFARGWQELDDKVPPLPCSIADRVTKDAEPVVAAFLDVLSLPDSRFQVSQLLAFLRIPAMQRKFAISIEEIDKLSHWLELAAIHWGLDSAHKASTLNTAAETTNDTFTWKQGLSRLLRGFAFGDHSFIFQNQLLLPVVEGNDAELLGKLMLVVERLQYFSQKLNINKTAEQWQKFLFSLVDELFDIEGEYCFVDISNAIEALAENCLQAQFDEKLPRLVVSDFLHSHFSQPEPGRQFMIGQVTFCSMVPMRSIPFKVVAILGLNDGEFPRQRQPLGFDLLATTPPRLGDRSRRGDDRYLFLEAIISARQSLYLSYQGRNIKNNTEKQPSIVLKELLEYLTLGYGWHASDAEENDSDNRQASVRYLPMQPFSLENYNGLYASFDDKWLKLVSACKKESEKTSDEESDELEPLIISSEPNEHLSETLKVKAEQVIQFFQHPSKSFAQSQLNLNLSNRSIVLEDVEPFSINQLDSYLMRQAFLETQLAKEQDVNVEETKAARIDNVTTEATLSGHFPDLPTTPQVFERWLDDSQDFADEIKDKGMANPELIPQKLLLSIDQGNAQSVQIELSVSMPLIQEQQVFYRSSSAKSKDKFMLYLHQLILQCLQQEQGNNTDQKIPAKSQAEIMELETTRLEAKLFDTKQTCGFYFDTKAQKVSQLVVQYIPDPKVKLEKLMSLYLQGNNRALLLNSDLADKCFKSKKFEQAEFEAYWHDTNSFMPFGEDPYIRYFWPKCPAFETIESLLTEIYQPLYDAILPVKKGKKVVVAKAVTKAVEKGAS